MDGGLDDQDENVRIAVKALGDMRNSTNTRPSGHTSDSSSDTINPSNSPAFVERMSHLPFVNSALRVYEQGKASSRVVKYGAEMVESSVKTISRPVINHLPVDVSQLDEFACRQLDRLDRYRHPSGESQGPSTSPDPSNQDRERGKQRLKTKTLDGSALEDDVDTGMQRDESSSLRHHGGVGDKGGWLEANGPYITPAPAPPDSRSSTPTQIGDESRSKSSVSRNLDVTQVAQRSRWQAVLLEAGGLSAALSEESMQRLKYCLHWLQYATAFIDAHILFLRNFTADLQPLPSDTAAESTPRPPISEEHMRRLIDVKRDIVHTIRQAVDIVSKYAGGALPEPARTRVRGFILTLPQRWASKAGGTGAGAINTAGNGERDSTVTAAASGTGATRRPGGQRRAAYRERGSGGIEGDLRSGASSRAPSPSLSPRIPRTTVSRRGSGGGDMGEGGENVRVPAGTALVAAQRILALATESLDMMRNVTGVMKDSLDRAEAWVGRLRTVGIQRDTQVEETGTSEFESPRGSDQQQQQHRRDHSGGSTQFDEPDQDMPSSPFFSASSTVWGSSNPSTPLRGTFTPVYAGAGGKGGMVSPIPIGAMSLSSRYETPRSGISSLADEEEEEEEEERVEGDRDGKDVVNRKMQEGSGQVRVDGDEEDKGFKMDVDVDMDVRG